MPIVTLDLHGYRREVEVPRVSARLTVPMSLRLHGAGVGDESVLVGNEETTLIATVAFRLKHPATELYVCDGCPLCDPYRLDRLVRAAAREAATVAARATLEGIKLAAQRSARLARYLTDRPGGKRKAKPKRKR